jgi:hypothetical protein
MIEYAAALGSNLGSDLAGSFVYWLDTLLTSPYFWPGVVITVVGIAFLARQLSS